MMEKGKFKITKQEYIKRVKFFKKCVNYYFFEIFHLYEFQLTISSDESTEIRAGCYWSDINDGAGIINIYYSIPWIMSKETTYDEINKVAFHETWEAILSELQELIIERFISKKDIANAVHRVIRRMENIVFPLIKTS
jgi:hypothetical protein